MKTKAGFTLIELSIVMVLIGLAVGGVLVGRDMISAATARSVVAQINGYNGATTIFLEKYDQLPGDFSNAVSALNVAANDNGDGNGSISYTKGNQGVDTPITIAHVNHAGGDTNEYALFWEHLSKALLIDGSYNGTVANVTPGTNFPKPKTGVGGILAFTDSKGINRFFVGILASSGTAISYGATDTPGVGVMRPDIAYNIDRKLDDGIANQGFVKAQQYDSINTLSLDLATPPTECTYFSPDFFFLYYDLSKTGVNCKLNIIMSL
jgi:prepilin-type N-terminal cleavage/methylation domain-containing protein